MRTLNFKIPKLIDAIPIDIRQPICDFLLMVSIVTVAELLRPAVCDVFVANRKSLFSPTVF